LGRIEERGNVLGKGRVIKKETRRAGAEGVVTRGSRFDGVEDSKG